MPDQVNAAAAIALNRFGLGARPGEAPPADPAGWLKGQLEAYEPLPPPIAKLGDPPARLAATIETLRQLRDAREQQETDQQRRRELLSRPREDYRISVKARAEAAVQSSTPFVERLVHFWSNHFAVSKERAVAAPFIPIFETAAIRPHVLGRFEDMVLAVERHPAKRNRSAPTVPWLSSPNGDSPGGRLASTKTWRARFSNCTRSAPAAATRNRM
jgi:uncharacterized protein (DUF1800 family)